MSELPRLHLPSEPDPAAWRDHVAANSIEELIAKEDGFAAWLWERWSVVERVGLDRGYFVKIVLGYRREVWLWLMGERTWTQCCSGLLGRVERRISAG